VCNGIGPGILAKDYTLILKMNANKKGVFIEFKWIISYCPTFSKNQYSYIVPQELERLYYKRIIIDQLEGEMSILWHFVPY